MAKNDYLRRSSLDVEGNLNFRRIPEKKRYNDWLLGRALRTDLGHNEDDGNSTSTPPAWVQSHTGKNQAFVISNVSSSLQNSLNVYMSGTEAAEQTEMSASVEKFYTKNATETKIYSLTASSDLSGTLHGVGKFVASLSASRLYDNGNEVFSERSSDVIRFPIFVPDYGRILNIRVWVEIINTALGQSTLRDINLAISSPNVTGFKSIPWMNSPKFIKKIDYNYNSDSFYENTFILFYPDLDDWGNDFHIRTVFDESSHRRNPADLGILFASGTNSHESYLLAKDSPNNIFSSSLGNGFGSKIGGCVPWFNVLGVETGFSGALGAKESADSQSPPVGWLTAPGGENATGEFETTGSNWGPDTIRPLYSLLDPVEEEILEGESLVGVRPGLRGTEVHGEWNLLLKPSFIGSPVAYYFRQWRLEVTFEVDKKDSIRRFYNSGKDVERKPISELSTSYYGEAFRSRTKTKVYRAGNKNPGKTHGITASTSSYPNFAVFSRLTGSLADLYGENPHWFIQNEFKLPSVPISSGSGENASFNIRTDVENNKKHVSEVFNPKQPVSKAITLKSVLSKYQVTKKTRDTIQSLIKSGSL